MSKPLDPGPDLDRCAVEVDLSPWHADPEFTAAFPIGFARTHRMVALRGEPVAGRDDLGSRHPDILAVADEDGLDHVEIVIRRLARWVEPRRVAADEIDRTIDRVYADRGSQTQAVLDAMDDETLRLEDATNRLVAADLLDADSRAPVIQLVNQILFDAVKAGASDIHIQPYEDRVMVRHRIDGVLFDQFEIPKAIQEEVLTRIKVLGKMNIAEKRLPQDGRATVSLGATRVDLRIASLPTSHNERIVIRLLDKSARLYTLDELGMPPSDRDRFGELIRRDHGMLLVTGPTGSGKSTTLYGALAQINSNELNVLTLEDPIEYQLEGISQTQINERKGMTFASGMRSVLRQDPDIIMVGEIRDHETAVMAIQASLTGHLVFSTLHTNDAASAVTRMLDLGIEPYLVSSSLVAVLAQRLVRRLCEDCRRVDPTARLPQSALPTAGVSGSTASVYRAVGCPGCRGTGYRGRVGLFELLIIDDAIRDAVTQRAPAGDIRRLGIEGGMKLLVTDGHEKVAAGMTTMEEVLRVTSDAADGGSVPA